MTQSGFGAHPFPIPRLMLVTDRTLVPPGTLTAMVERAVAGGVDAVQLREKDLPEADLIALGRELRAATRGRALLLVNGTVEQAIACEADGVHLAERDPPPRPPSLAGKEGITAASAEQSWRSPTQMKYRNPRSNDSPPSLRGKGAGGLGFLFGRSVHSVDAARRAAAEGVDYVVLGTIYPSRSHPGGPTSGAGLVTEACRVVETPVIGIGGITVENAGEVIRAGAAGVAVISAILAASDPCAAAAGLRKAIDAAARHPVGELA